MSVPFFNLAQLLYSVSRIDVRGLFVERIDLRAKYYYAKNKDTAAEDVIFLVECTNKFIQSL